MGDAGFLTFIGDNLKEFWLFTGFANATYENLIMIAVGLLSCT